MGQWQFGPVGTFSGTRQAHRDSQVWGLQFRSIKEQSELGWSLCVTQQMGERRMELPSDDCTSEHFMVKYWLYVGHVFQLALLPGASRAPPSRTVGCSSNRSAYYGKMEAISWSGAVYEQVRPKAWRWQQGGNLG